MKECTEIKFNSNEPVGSQEKEDSRENAVSSRNLI